MNEKLLFLLDGQEELYPINLEEQFPDILERMVELWNSSEIDGYFHELMITSHDGKQHEFPLRVASEILELSVAHAKIREQRLQSQSSNPWGNVSSEKRAAIEQQGYRFSPRGFIQSAEKGDSHAVALFLKSGVDIDTRDERGWSPLMVSSFNGNEKLAELLIISGANVQIKDSAGYGPLHWAAFSGYTNVVKLLLEKKANVNACSNHGWTALLQASSRGHLLTAGYLIARGADVNLSSNDGWTPLHKAAANGHTEIVKLLLAKGAYYLAEYQDGTTPLALAIKNKHKAIEALLSAIK